MDTLGRGKGSVTSGDELNVLGNSSTKRNGERPSEKCELETTWKVRFGLDPLCKWRMADIFE